MFVTKAKYNELKKNLEDKSLLLEEANEEIHYLREGKIEICKDYNFLLGKLTEKVESIRKDKIIALKIARDNAKNKKQYLRKNARLCKEIEKQIKKGVL